MTILPASKLDAEDPLARFRSRFVAADDPAVVAYLDGNSLGRPLTVTAERLAAFVDGAWGRGLIRSWGEAWMAEPMTVGDRLAEVALGAAPGQVIVADSTTVLLYKLIRAGLSVRRDRDEIVIDRANFPTDRFVVDGIAAECGLTVRYLSAPHDAGVRAGGRHGCAQRAHRTGGAQPYRLPVRVHRGHGGDHPRGPRRGGADAVGPVPFRRRGPRRARRLWRRPGGRRHL